MQTKISDRIKSIVTRCFEEQKRTGEVPEELVKHLFNLIDLLERKSQRVFVKKGKFGFCTCSTTHSLCYGCWRIKEKCLCVILSVNPGEIIG
jgi:hypothetical protein